MKRGVVLKRAWKIARAYWFSEEKWLAWRLLLGVIALNLSTVYITIQINLWHGDFYQAIQSYDYPGFIHSIGTFCILAFMLVVVHGYQVYFRMLLHIRWRQWLTKEYLQRWLRYQTYYRMQLLLGNEADNPDQRISEDVELFVALTLRLSLDLLQDIITVSSFVVILWQLSGVLYIQGGGTLIPVYGYLVWLAFLYAGAGTYWTLKLGRPLVGLDYNQQRYEADFRFYLARLRENAESIAFYRGERQEQQNALGRFREIVDNFLKIRTVRRQLMWLTSGYAQVAVIFAVLVAAPRYFSGQIHLGQMFQISDAYGRVQNGFSFVVDSFTRIAQWRAVINRLNNFLIFMEMVYLPPKAQEQLQTERHYRKEYAFTDLSVLQPDGRVLASRITAAIKPADRVLISGPSGCGKSTLLRTLAGIWPYAQGHVAVPKRGTIMFVPQKSYMPVDSLRAVLLYPAMTETVGTGEIKRMLEICRLAYLGDRLEVVMDWDKVLSLGEQQRVAFVRVLLHKPDWLFLDEATSALDDDNEQAMYEAVLAHLPGTAVVSIGHRRTLVGYHRHRLELNGQGGWRLSPL
ncbi:hypothetical protein P22_3818 [Propionispora sp. 2/2-37]|uniref:ABC transporter ATP-binding protein/permease n=1 Tax=Propionispora sp. 2/2-37 TaxID=1677858 RepID=UPI0006BB7FA1|nr:ABC transporter ATP-binding protein/permease [Propionispora sp. 2/2-37]CUH97683.1 hypothetical protein P22_3818 [Propionispora sp. 2/2-37]